MTIKTVTIETEAGEKFILPADYVDSSNDTLTIKNVEQTIRNIQKNDKLELFHSLWDKKDSVRRF